MEIPKGGFPLNRTEANGSYRTFLILWLFQSLPVIGSSVMFFTMVLWLTQSVFIDPTQQVELTRAISFLSLSFSLPALIFAPLAGSIVDRFSRRNVMLIANICGATIAATMTIGMLLNKLPLSMLFTFMAGLSIATAFHNSAFDASTVMLVSQGQLPRANGLMQTTWALSSIVSPPLATLLVSLPALVRQGHLGFLKLLGQLQTGTPIALAFGVLTLILAVLPLPFLFIPSPLKNNASTDEASRDSMINELKTGFFFIWQRKPLLWLLLIFAGANLAIAPLEVFRPIILRFNLAESYTARGYTFETALALLGSLQGMGLLAGGILVSVWGGLKTKRVYGVIIPMILNGMVLAIFGMSFSFYISACMISFLGASIPMMNVHSQAIWQTQTPPELQGRVFALRRVIAQFTGPMGTALAGWIGGIFSPATILTLLGSILVIFAISQFFNKTLLSQEIFPSSHGKSEFKQI